MTQTLIQIAVAFAALAILGMTWFGLQAGIRRFFPSMAHDGDPFRARFGCGGCAGDACDPDERAAA